MHRFVHLLTGGGGGGGDYFSHSVVKFSPEICYLTSGTRLTEFVVLGWRAGYMKSYCRKLIALLQSQARLVHLSLPLSLSL